jgi:hypothetical protein
MSSCCTTSSPQSPAKPVQFNPKHAYDRIYLQGCACNVRAISGFCCVGMLNPIAYPLIPVPMRLILGAGLAAWGLYESKQTIALSTQAINQLQNVYKNTNRVPLQNVLKQEKFRQNFLKYTMGYLQMALNSAGILCTTLPILMPSVLGMPHTLHAITLALSCLYFTATTGVFYMEKQATKNKLADSSAEQAYWHAKKHYLARTTQAFFLATLGNAVLFGMHMSACPLGPSLYVASSCTLIAMMVGFSQLCNSRFTTRIPTCLPHDITDISATNLNILEKQLNDRKHLLDAILSKMQQMDWLWAQYEKEFKAQCGPKSFQHIAKWVMQHKKQPLSPNDPSSETIEEAICKSITQHFIALEHTKAGQKILATINNLKNTQLTHFAAIPQPIWQDLVWAHQTLSEMSSLYSQPVTPCCSKKPWFKKAEFENLSVLKIQDPLPNNENTQIDFLRCFLNPALLQHQIDFIYENKIYI